MSFPPHTRRLTFRTWTNADLPLALSLWSDPEVARYLGGPMSTAAAADRLQLERHRQQTLGFQYWPIFQLKSGIFAGCAGLRPFHDEPRVFEVGVHIARAFWSQRFGEEAARGVIDYAFTELGAVALTAGHNPENINSRAMIQRLGFCYTHDQPWGPLQLLHPFYRLERAAWSEVTAGLRP